MEQTERKMSYKYLKSRKKLKIKKVLRCFQKKNTFRDGEINKSELKIKVRTVLEENS